MRDMKLLHKLIKFYRERKAWKALKRRKERNDLLNNVYNVL